MNGGDSGLFQRQEFRASSEFLNIREWPCRGGAGSEFPMFAWDHVIETVAVLVILFGIVLILFFFVALVFVGLFF